MKKRVIVGSIVGALILIGAVGSASNPSQTSNLTAPQSVNADSFTKDTPKKTTPVCDGTVVTSSCAVDGITYATYIQHPAVAEKSHDETVTTYKQEVTSYCTLCNDGTYSPSCATGSGTCSHHDGVAQWNAPRYSNVPVTSIKTVIDAPAQEAYLEKIAQ